MGVSRMLRNKIEELYEVMPSCVLVVTDEVVVEEWSGEERRKRETFREKKSNISKTHDACKPN